MSDKLRAALSAARTDDPNKDESGR